MLITPIIAKLSSVDKIQIIIPLTEQDSSKTFTLIKDGIAINVLKLFGTKNYFDHIEMTFSDFPFLELGHRYHVADEKFVKVVLDIKESVNFSSFDEKYFYDGSDLGATHHRQYTDFVVWAPLCSSVKVILHVDETSDGIEMMRSDSGVYRLRVKGDLDGVTYLYQVVINDIVKNITDPYAIGSTLNSMASVVINKAKINIDLHEKNLPILKSYCDAIIYEASIRDLSSYEHTTIKLKGTFLALTESAVNDKKKPVGLDYLKQLDITHLQLLPIFDFATIDEANPKAKYNWGYDPRQYNVPEGSYASNLFDPYSRIIDLKKMIAKLHQSGIKVNMDVVYNHVHEYENSVFETIVPGYYFRKNSYGEISNGSFCGNDLDTKRLMVRKFIVDSCLFWMKEYGIDGFRFDLLGIIDIETTEAIIKAARNYKLDCMLYGEGWNMPTALNDNEKSSMHNASRISDIAFFNDVFRDIAKGKTYGDNINERGYLLGNIDYREAFKFIYQGSSCTTVSNPLFLSPSQSINYVECHDNATLYDKITSVFENEPEPDILRRIKLINAVNILAFGIPFLHMGQEVGLSKSGHQNSYKAGDMINQFNYSYLNSREDMYQYVMDLIALRKKYPCFRFSTCEEISQNFSCENLDSGALSLTYRFDNQELKVIINPSNHVIYHSLPTYYEVIFNEAGMIEKSIYTQSVMLAKINMVILLKR